MAALLRTVIDRKARRERRVFYFARAAPDAKRGAGHDINKRRLESAVQESADPADARPDEQRIDMIGDQRCVEEKQRHRKPLSARHRKENEGEREVDESETVKAQVRRNPSPYRHRGEPARSQKLRGRQYLRRPRLAGERERRAAGGEIDRNDYPMPSIDRTSVSGSVFGIPPEAVSNRAPASAALALSAACASPVAWARVISVF